jgi:PAS domain S-box-containing protein
MGKFLLRKIFTDNISSALIYLIGAYISYLISFQNFYFLPIWIPLGLSVGIILYKGIKNLPGILIASLISHLYFSFKTLNLNSINLFYFATVILFVVAEMVILYFLHRDKEYRKWTDYKNFSEFEASRFLIQSLLIPLPLLIVYGWFLHQTNVFNEIINTILISLYFGTSASILVFTPLYLSLIKQLKSKSFEDNKHLFNFIVLLVFLLLILANHFLPLLNLGSKIPIFLLAFPLLLIISIKYSLKIYTFTITILCLSFLAKPLIQEFTNEESIVYYAEILGFIIIVSLSSLYIKGQKYVINRTRGELKTNYNFIENEIARQVDVYKQLNDSLLQEIERRGIAESELVKNRRLLTEAQEISKISTWEYSIAQKKFKWIYHNEKISNFNIGFESSSIRSIVKRLHPEDLEKLKKIRNEILQKNGDFELEVRFLTNNDNYSYFLVRGRSFSENGKTTRVLGLLMDITERKQAGLELAEKEQKYQALFDSNIDPVCVIDAKSLIIQDVNPAFESIYGYNRDEIIGESYLRLTAQPDDTKTIITFANQKGYYRASNMVHKRKQGDEFFIEGNLMIYMVKDKKMLFIISHDITNRKENELRLAEREQKFRSFIESDLIGMAEFSIAKQWISFNEKLTKILGYSSKELNAKTWDQITNAEDLEVEVKLFRKILTHEMEGYTIEKRFITKNSSEVFCKVAVKAIKTTKYTISHLIMMVDDISDRKRTEAELRESRAQLSQSQSVAKLGSIRIQPGFNQVNLSNETYEILGYGSKRPILSRRDFFKTNLPGPHTRFEQIICDLENGLLFEGSHEQAFLTPSGGVKYLLLNFGVSKDKNLQVKEVLVTLADITRIKQAEMALQETNALKDQLFSIIGHDLRSPIGSIKQMIEILLYNRSEIDEETRLSILTSLKKTSDETFDLLVNLLEWAKSQQIDSFKPVISDLVTHVNQVLSISQGMADAKNISLQKNLPLIAPVIVDVDMMKTILRNLISNSIKFTPQTGVVMVSIKEINDRFNISISDTGIGIPKEILSKLFDSKSAITTSGTNNEKGTGLGLKLVKKFVEKNGGTISVTSELGQGSNFSFTIPKYIGSD